MENHETFFARVTPLYPPSEVQKIRLAYILGKAGHRNQFRKETDENGNKVRYWEHPRRTALIWMDEFGLYSWRGIVKCLLHDGLEDIRGLTEEMLEQYFDTEVCRGTKFLTKNPKEGYYEKLIKYGDLETLSVKFADRLDNLRSLPGCEKAFIEKQVKETEEKFMGSLLHRVYQEAPAKLYLVINNSLRTELDSLKKLL